MTAVLLPQNLSELWQMVSVFPDATVYAGGTDLLVKLKIGQLSPQALICLERIPELKGVVDGGDHVTIHAATPFSQLLTDSLLIREFPALCQAMTTLGSPLIRNMGTIGGNICTASPAGDTIPPLTVLNAELELVSANGIRHLPINRFITGPGQIGLYPGEILSAIHVPKPKPGSIQFFEKVGQRNALTCSIVSMAAIVWLSDTNRVDAVSLAWGSVGPTIMTCPGVENMLTGHRLTSDILKKAGNMVIRTVLPITDIRASADYRRKVAGNLMLRLCDRYSFPDKDFRGWPREGLSPPCCLPKIII
ncbi:MAG: xanthine dehydrogenase family protein subunit M [Desulfatirhabdiaceae bacterium]